MKALEFISSILFYGRAKATVDRPETVNAGFSCALDVRHVEIPTSLKAGRVITFRMQRKGQLVCLNGRLWITQTGNPGDHVLEPGDTYNAKAAGNLVVEALSDCSFEITPRPHWWS
ncbi:MAG TPA: DUF2917 domain-containing protein [Kiritimatiellia bacterium]|nr:DUF2917 domain-containing protein [Kiritimatiellia bacterium]